MEDYKYVHGKHISVGDVIVYDEGDGYCKSIEEVVEHEGELATVMRVGEPRWTVLEDQEPIQMKFCKAYAESQDNTAVHCAIARVPHDEAFTAEFAESQFGA